MAQGVDGGEQVAAPRISCGDEGVGWPVTGRVSGAAAARAAPGVGRQGLGGVAEQVAGSGGEDR